MSTGQIIQTILMALVFLAWAGLIGRTLALWRRRAAQGRGGTILKQAGRWLRAPEDKSERGTLMFLTFVLLVMAGTSVFLG